MKKVFLPIIAAAMYLAASATPATFNYQGVCDYKNAKNVEVTFTLTDGTITYVDKQYVETNSNGMFTTTIGNDDLGGYDFENGNWTLTVSVNGGEPTACILRAVPYALNAKGLNEVIDDVQGLQEKMRGVASVNEVADLTGAVEELQEAVKAMNDIEGDGLGAWTAQNIGALYEGLGVVEDDLREQVYMNHEQQTEINALLEWQKGVDGELENAYMTGQVAQAAYDMADANADAIAIVSSDVQGIQESLRGKANVDEVNASIAELEAADQAMEEYTRDLNETLMVTFEEVYNELEALKAGVANSEETGNNQAVVIKKIQDSLAEVKVDAQATSTQVATLENGLSVVEDDVRDLVENFVPKVNGDLAGLAADLAANVNLAQSLSEDLYKEDGIVDQLLALVDLNLPNVVENLEMMTPMLQQMEENIDTLLEGLGNTQQDVMELVLANRENKTDIAELKALDLPNVVENLEMMTPMLQEMEENITALQEGADVLSTDVAELVQANRENKTDIAELKIDLESAGQLANKAGEVAYTNAETILDIQEGLTNTQDDVQGLVEDNMSNKAAIADLQVQLNRLSETVKFLHNLLNVE